MKQFFKELMQAAMALVNRVGSMFNNAMDSVFKTVETVEGEKKALHKYLPYALLFLAIALPSVFYGVLGILFFYGYVVTITVAFVYIGTHLIVDALKFLGVRALVA